MNRLSLLAIVLGGCFGGVAGDAKDDSFGGDQAKSDGLYSTCQLAEVLKFANESTTTIDKLKEAGLSDQAAKSILGHRNGADGQAGTGDDDIFDNLRELDGVNYVGNLALGKLVEEVLPRCEVDLATRKFMDSTTFAGQTSGGWGRDNEEVEVVLGVSGITGQKLRSLLLTKDADGRTLYERIRKSRAMEAFSYGYSMDEMPWDSDTQDVREQLPYVSLTIESGRFEPDPEDGIRKISLGTDLMDDSYFDTPGFSMLSAGLELRARARWDDPTTVRRILVAAKFGTQIDSAGNKTNTKVDVRNDGASAAQIAALDDGVRAGKVDWSGSVLTPVKGIYEQAKEKGFLQDIGMHTGVLIVDPTAHLRSTRSRYHMNETSIDTVRSVYRNAATRITAALAQIDKAQAANAIPAANKAQVDAVEAMGRAILDKTLLAQRISAAGVSVTAATLVLPDAQTQPTTGAALAQNKIIAETISTVFHEFATALDDADRVITNAVDDDFDDYAEAFMAWRKSAEASLKVKQSWDSFVASYTSLSTAANRANSLSQFNVFLTQGQSMAALDDAGWTRLGGYLDKMVLSVAERQIETAGLAATQLWFDQARELWVPASNRAYSNFMIDTTDMVDMLSMQEWNSIPEAERTFTAPLPAAKVFNTVFVNELQVELGSEAAYVARIKELTEKLAANPSDAATKEQLEGAKWVWEQYTGSMKVLTEVKGENVLRKLKNAGAPSTIKWTAPPDSKGNQALKILADRDS